MFKTIKSKILDYVPPKLKPNYPSTADLQQGEPASGFGYNTDLDRGKTLREIVMGESNKGEKLNFLDLGGRDGKLKTLLGIEKGIYDKERHKSFRKAFNKKFSYTGCDLKPKTENVIVGDFCDPGYLDDNRQYINYFDVIYSNNVFEHLNRPWITVKHIDKMLRVGGLCIIVVPFAQRYHKSPVDHFRYSHTAIANLFYYEADGNYKCLVTGYDTYWRRLNVFGRHNNAIAEDAFGGWRETWLTVTALRKIDKIK